MKYEEKIEAFKQIQHRYGSFLELTIWKLTGKEDLFAESHQNALLIIWQSIERISQVDKSGYIYRIALSAVQKACRQKPKGQSVTFEPFTSESEESQSQAIEKETYARLRRFILELPKKRARAVVMRYLNGCDYDQIANELQCSESAARAHVSRAVTELTEKMNRLSRRDGCYGK